ncbi:hypothetical protein Clacol_004848 [Clathrus columnatus]|uniref:Potassium channel domain-containing protein n=1 Tax=Clathrus columnatus TaxID=1419009 RepID=A0AAV5A7L8_9AGAM|nr:hypothetical protein Clacol_004848 [Clathrus columnatus]
MSLLPIIVPIVQTITEQALTNSPTNKPKELEAEEKGTSNDIEFRGRSPNFGKKDVQFRSFPTNSTWSSNISNFSTSPPEEPWFRSSLRRIWNFIFHRDDSQSIDEVVPYYRWLPILSGVTIPFSILLQIPGCTERWFVPLLPLKYVRTLDNQTVQSRQNPPILLAANIVAMIAALAANICLIIRFLEKKVKRMTIISLCLLSVHDVINVVAVTIFGIEHRFNDGFTYGQPYWLVVASTVVSLFTTVTLLWDLWKTPDFSKSGSGLTHKQRSLVVIVIVLLCWITFGGLVNSILLHLTYIDGLYFTVVSIETIGFGDIHPNSTSSRIFAIIYNSIGIITIGIAISTARETVIESFEVSYRRRLSEVATRREEFKKIKERQRTRKHVIERMLRMAGQPSYIPDAMKPGKMRLNEEGLTPAQLTSAENETLFLMNRKHHYQLRGSSPHENSFTSGGRQGVTFDRTFSLDSTVSDIVSSQMYEENYRDFKLSILREERREFAAKMGAVIFSQTEKWSYGISLYFCFVAFSSIGYGDYSPETPAGRSVFVVWALLGVGTMTILVSVLCEACSSRYKNALTGGSFQRAVKNFRKRREISPSPNFHNRVHSRTRSQSNSHSRDLSPPGLNPNSNSYFGINGISGAGASGETVNNTYTVEHAKRDLEALPGELLSHARTFHDHVYYFMSSLDGDEPIPAPLEKLLNEIAESEHMADGLRKEVLRDDGARRALFMMSYEGALKKMIETAEKAVTLLSQRDLLSKRERDSGGGGGGDNESKISKLSSGLQLDRLEEVKQQQANFDEQRYLRRSSESSGPGARSSSGIPQDPPINIFTYFDLPLSTPVSAIRATLLEYQAQEYGYRSPLLPSTETLLTRLGSFESRVTYLKYGPAPLALCKHCVYQTDFAFFAVAPTVLSYLLALILTSLLTTSYVSKKANWRTPALFVFGAMFFSEAWWVFNTLPPLRDERVKGLTHTHIFIFRNIILLLVPLIIHHLPPYSVLSPLPPFIIINRPSPNNLNLKFNFFQPSTSTTSQALPQDSNIVAALNTILNGMGSTVGALRALEWVRYAGLRKPEIRERITDYHSTLGRNAARVRDDSDMILTARQAGLGYSVPHQNEINNISESEDEDRGASHNRSSYLLGEE